MKVYQSYTPCTYVFSATPVWTITSYAFIMKIMQSSSSILLPSNVSTLDAALYLTSLVSNKEKIEPIIARIDAITKRPGFTKELTHEDNDALRFICWQLATYLVSEEKVRVFTLDDLERRIEQRFAPVSETRKVQVTLLIVFVVTALSGFFAIQINPPMPLSTTSRLEYSALLVIPTMFSVLSLGAAWFFYTATRYFRANLKLAYRLIVAAVALLGIAHLQFPFLAYTQNLRGPWVSDGAIGFIYVSIHILLLVGALVFARIFTITSRFASWPLLMSAALVGVLAVTLAPHSPPIWGELLFDVAISMFVIGVVASLAAALVFYSLARKINELYQLPMRWLGHANLLLGLSVAQILLVRFLFGFSNFWTDYGLIFIPHLLASAAFLRAGYIFNKASGY